MKKKSPRLGDFFFIFLLHSSQNFIIEDTTLTSFLWSLMSIMATLFKTSILSSQALSSLFWNWFSNWIYKTDVCMVSWLMKKFSQQHFWYPFSSFEQHLPVQQSHPSRRHVDAKGKPRLEPPKIVAKRLLKSDPLSGSSLNQKSHQWRTKPLHLCCLRVSLFRSILTHAQGLVRHFTPSPFAPHTVSSFISAILVRSFNSTQYYSKDF